VDYWWVLMVCIKWAFLKTPRCFFGWVQLYQHWRQLWTFSWFFESNFKAVLFQRASFSWFYDVSL